MSYKEHIGSNGLLKKHFQDCNVFPLFDIIEVLVKEKLEKILMLKSLFIAEIKPSLKTKDKF